MLFSLLLFFALHQNSFEKVVPCPDQATYCECEKGVPECEFTLRIEERFSFVSYILNSQNELTETGFLHGLSDTGFQSRGKTGECSFTNTYRDRDFQNRGCSVPLTLDGNNYRSVLTINGGIPGPTLVVHENQTVIVHVINKLTDAATSIHWHGMHQRQSVWMDGVGQVTQPPIDPGSSFDYIFKAEPTGTHWYHSHVGSQKSDGLFGALIVCEEKSLSEILGDRSYQHVTDLFGAHTIAITDWQRKPEAIHQAISGISFFPDTPVGVVPSSSSTPPAQYQSADGASQGPFPFWSGLINGKGRKFSSPPTPLSIFHVGHGNLYHFRLIGSTSIFAFNFSIDSHKLKAIASDGNYFEPVDVDYIIIHSGETYDFLLDTTATAAVSSNTDFWIRATTLEEDLEPGEDHSALAILSFRNPSDIDWTDGFTNVPEIRKSCSSDNPCEVLNCPFSNHPDDKFRCVSLTSLVHKPSQNLNLNEQPKFPTDQHCTDCDLFLNFAFVNKRNAVNGNRFKLPALSYATNCNQYSTDLDDMNSNICGKCSTNSNTYSSMEEVCECTSVYPIVSSANYNSNSEPPSIAIVISAINAGFSHPVHLHGHSFHVVYIGNATEDLNCKDNSIFCADPEWKNGIPSGVLNRAPNGRVISTAIRKDTIVVQNDGYVVIAFQADNPGFWFMHCHVEEHLIDGMAVIIQEYSSNQQWAPPRNVNLHGSFKWTAEEYNSVIREGKRCSTGNINLPLNWFILYAFVIGAWEIMQF